MAAWTDGDRREWPSVSDPDCEHCGAGADEACRPTCECQHCLRKAAREDARQRALVLELAE